MLSLLRLLALLILLVMFYRLVLLPWHRRWGATPTEADGPLPGDELVPAPTMQSTRAITIQAPVTAVWPWIVQIGQEKGGFYSYEWLENLAGCRIHTADRIVPEFQTTGVGDLVRLGPKGYPFFIITEIVPNQAMILQAADPKSGAPGPASWAFVLGELADGGTRLISRNRGAFPPTLANFILWRAITEPAAFIMEQKMLRRIKALAEQHAAQHAPA
jgi:hypothetical protein